MGLPGLKCGELDLFRVQRYIPWNHDFSRVGDPKPVRPRLVIVLKQTPQKPLLFDLCAFSFTR